MQLKAIFGLVGALALLALIYLAQDRFHQAGLAKDARNCASASATPGKPLDDCLPEVAVRVIAARRAEVCDSALSSREPELFAIRASCSAAVKTLVAQRDGALGQAEAAQTTIDQLIAGQSQAVERAERRADAALTKAQNNERTIRNAPRRADGLIACDADCLRKLAD